MRTPTPANDNVARHKLLTFRELKSVKGIAFTRRHIESGIRGHVGRQEIDFASRLESLWRLGWLSFGFRSWTGDKPISRHPSGVPILDGLAAHGAFKAADLASLCNVLAAVINRAAFTGSMTGF